MTSKQVKFDIILIYFVYIVTKKTILTSQMSLIGDEFIDMSHMQTNISSNMYWKICELFVKSTNLSCSKVLSLLWMLHHHHSFNVDVNWLDIFSHKCRYVWIISLYLSCNSSTCNVSVAIFGFKSQTITIHYNLSQSAMFSSTTFVSLLVYRIHRHGTD